MAKYLIAEHVEPKYEQGHVVGYYLYRDYAERSSPPASVERTGPSVPGLHTAQASTPTRAPVPPQPTPRRVHRESFPAPDTFKLVNERQHARARGLSGKDAVAAWLKGQ